MDFTFCINNFKFFICFGGKPIWRVLPDVNYQSIIWEKYTEQYKFEPSQKENHVQIIYN